MNIQQFLFLLIITCSLYSSNIAFSETSNNQTAENDKDNQDTTENFFKIILPIIGTAAVSLYLSLRQYVKEKEKQRLQYQYKLEFEYDINLRKKRIIAYEGLWELTKIDFDKDTSIYATESQRSDLSRWYYRNGQGMLLTESSQKLFHNFRRKLEKFKENSSSMVYTCERCCKEEEVRGKCKECSSSQEKCKWCEIKFLENFASAFRTNLLKDIGTRDELKRRSQYYEIYIKWIDRQEIDLKSNPYGEVNFRYFFIGTEPKQLKNGIVYIIKNIDKNIPEFLTTTRTLTLEPGKQQEFSYNLNDFNKDPLEAGNYSLKIVADTISSEQTFKLYDVYEQKEDVQKNVLKNVQKRCIQFY